MMTNILRIDIVTILDQLVCDAHITYQTQEGKTTNTTTVYTHNQNRQQMFIHIRDSLLLLGHTPTVTDHYKSTMGCIKVCNFNGNDEVIIVKPFKGEYYKTARQNESILVNIVNEVCKDKPHRVTFKSDQTTVSYSSIHHSTKNSQPRSRKNNNGKLYKADVHLIDNNGLDFPISIKDENGGYHWETADSLLRIDASNTMNNLIKKYNIRDFNSKQLKRDIVIDTHVDIEQCVFGSDIKKHNGCIVVSNFFDYTVTKKEVVFKCKKVFNDNGVFDDDKYKPVPIILKNSQRNKNHTIMKGLACVVTPNKRGHRAISVNDITCSSDFYN